LPKNETALSGNVFSTDAMIFAAVSICRLSDKYKKDTTVCA
jgi:hypothetical protein